MASADPCILIVDDEPPIRRLLRNTLSVQGFRTVEAATGRDALDAARREKPDLLILDLGLPDIDGLEVIKTLREKSQIPIVVLSSRGDETGKVSALDLGADDYVTKPFGVNELMARVRAALRHRLQQQGSTPVFQCGGLIVDLVHRRIVVDGRDVRLSPKEYDILKQFVIHAGKVLTHRHLMHEVWGGADSVDVQALRVFIRQLRQKIEANPEQPRYIITEPGVGYRLEMQE
jgi:two-component system, OmpR family, KDP operon response regulator KdpE